MKIIRFFLFLLLYSCAEFDIEKIYLNNDLEKYLNSIKKLKIDKDPFGKEYIKQIDKAESQDIILPYNKKFILNENDIYNRIFSFKIKKNKNIEIYINSKDHIFLLAYKKNGSKIISIGQSKQNHLTFKSKINTIIYLKLIPELGFNDSYNLYIEYEK